MLIFTCAEPNNYLGRPDVELKLRDSIFAVLLDKFSRIEVSILTDSYVELYMSRA